MNKLILLFICLLICSCASPYYHRSQFGGGGLIQDVVFGTLPAYPQSVHWHSDEREILCEDLYGPRTDFSEEHNGCITYYNEWICDGEDGGKWIPMGFKFLGGGICVMPMEEKDEHE